jgi:hypothetical protein
MLSFFPVSPPLTTLECVEIQRAENRAASLWRSFPGYAELEGRVPARLLFRLFGRPRTWTKVSGYWFRTKPLNFTGDKKTSHEMKVLIMTALANGWDQKDAGQWISDANIFNKVVAGEVFQQVRTLIGLWCWLHGEKLDQWQYGLAWGAAIEKARPNIERYHNKKALKANARFLNSTLYKIGLCLDQHGNASAKEIAAATGLSYDAVRQELCRKAGIPGCTNPGMTVAIVKLTRGVYGIEFYTKPVSVLAGKPAQQPETDEFDELRAQFDEGGEFEGFMLDEV